MTADVSENPRLSRFAWWRAAVLGASLAAVSVLRYATNGPSQTFLHEISLRLYYVPILIGAYWYGVPGGLAMAVVSSIAYVNRVSEIVHTLDRGRLAEVVVFHLVGVSIGMLASAQRRVARRYQAAAATLEQANATLRESHEQIRRMDRLRTLGEVATGLAHEIRHPLASIGGALEIIQARAVTRTPEAEFSQLALKEVQRLDRLVWEFLRYARPHAPELRTVVLDHVIEQAVTLLRVEAERGGVQLDVEPSTAPIDVTIDPLQIEQVLLNVLLNAIQATPAGGRVVVQERLADSEACVDVIDEGHGIDDRHLASIFNPFFTTREKGTGLGLAIAHRIVMSHDGHLDVVQTSPRGTWFRVGLPVHGVSKPAATPRVAAVPL